MQMLPITEVGGEIGAVSTKQLRSEQHKERKMSEIAKEEGSGSPSWGALLFKQTTGDVATAVAAAVNSPSSPVVYSSKDDNGGSQFERLQHQVTKVIKGFSHPPDVNTNYNPEILTSLKRQWAANFQLQHMDHNSWKEPSRLFESMVVVGLHPNCDVQALGRQYVDRKLEGSGKFRSALGYQNQSRIEPNINIEPQVLFVYPPEKRLPLRYKDLLSFCFPGGLEVRAVQRTPSLSELNEILFGQEQLKQRDLSFVFRLQGADNSVLYGCCVLVEELVHKPSGLLSLISDKQPSYSSSRHQVFTTQRCYCILSRLPFFELHFGVLNSIFTQERLERLTEGAGDLNLEFLEGSYDEESSEGNSKSMLVSDSPINRLDENPRSSVPENIVDDAHHEQQRVNGELQTYKEKIIYENVVPTDPKTNRATTKEESGPTHSEDGTSYSFQGSPCEDRNFRSDVDDNETDNASFSGQKDLNDLQDILKWAKENNHGQLQIISEYYHLNCPARGSALTFHPLEHLHPLEYHRLAETIQCLGGSTVDFKSFSTDLELADAHNALLAEEATALSIWVVACMCGTLRLENVLTFFAGVLLEKQIVVVCSNLGILSALVLSVIPLIRPYQWQSLLMPVLSNDMLEFLDAPVPFVVGIKNKTSEVQSKLTNFILVDANRNQVKSPTIPQLPRQKELVSSLRPYHATLVEESYLGRRRPVYECTEVQIEAAKGFLSVLRLYLDSLCFNIRSHTITNVQSNDDKVSLLLKESFIYSFPYRDRPFMKLFADTQLFSVHTDLILSFFQKE
ncbi:putative DENN domain-containing protein [Lupinus albus]|uniref:Putative DENN domain-containing protein n=1 Tax=Lupinus albus TaxID=3870 RepID=A0A6A4PJ65_LUPAL|nr:putative DENN domain-containing protein [Lupinus albus]